MLCGGKKSSVRKMFADSLLQITKIVYGNPRQVSLSPLFSNPEMNLIALLPDS